MITSPSDLVAIILAAVAMATLIVGHMMLFGSLETLFYTLLGVVCGGILAYFLGLR